MSEIWKSVVGFEGHYEVSNLGRVKSVRRKVPNKTDWMTVPERILRTRVSGGYPRVSLCKRNKYTHRHIHKLIMEAFIGPCPEGMEACHNDGDSNNCVLTNLRYDTRSENNRDRLLHKGGHKLTLKEVREIRAAYVKGQVSQQHLADKYRVSQVMISKIIRASSWEVT